MLKIPWIKLAWKAVSVQVIINRSHDCNEPCIIILNRLGFIYHSLFFFLHMWVIVEVVSQTKHTFAKHVPVTAQLHIATPTKLHEGSSAHKTSGTKWTIRVKAKPKKSVEVMLNWKAKMRVILTRFKALWLSDGWVLAVIKLGWKSRKLWILVIILYKYLIIKNKQFKLSTSRIRL